MGEERKQRGLMAGEKWSRLSSTLFYILFFSMSVYMLVLVPILGFYPQIYTTFVGGFPLTALLMILGELFGVLLGIWYYLKN